MAQKDVGNKIPIYKLKDTDEVMKYYDEWGDGNKYDNDMVDWIKNNAETTYHPVGTCKMGSDNFAVVDEELKVHGINGLRIADASIMPTLTSGNTNAPSIMIGEKCAEMILKAASSLEEAA